MSSQKYRQLLTTALIAMLGGWLAPQSRAQYVPPTSNRVDLNFNYDWKFIKGNPSGAQNVGFDDSQWSAVSLPHTWNDLDRYREWISSNAIYSPTTGPVQPPGDYPDPAYGQAPPNDPVLGTSGAYYGVGWYRKKFTLDAAYAGRKVIVEFSGITLGAHFYVNGKDVAYKAGSTTTPNTIQLPAITGINGDTTLAAQTLNCGYHENGIGPCGVDITDYLNPAGQENLIAVWVTNEANYVTQEYGTKVPYGQPFNLNFGGLQRDATLHVSDPLRQTLPLYRNLGTTGTYAYTGNIDTFNRTADLTVESEVANDYAADKTATMDAVIIDAAGNQVGNTLTTTAQTIQAGTRATFKATTSLTGVHFWDTNYPYMYQVYTVVKVGGTVVDVNKTPLGVHKWKFGSTIGLELNGHPIYLNGYAPRTTMEWPAVGIPPDWMVEYDFNLIKQSGGNFVRPMHSAPRRVQVDTADKLGVVMVCPATATENDETDPANWVQKVADMRDVCLYFRNNPSVYFWEGNNGDLSATHMQNMMDVTAQFDHGNVDITPGRDYRSNTRLIGTRAAGTGSAAAQRQFSSPIESNVRDADRPIWDAEYARGECPRHVWDNYTPMLNPFWDGKNPDPTPVQGSVSTFGDTAHKYIVGGYGYISNLYYEQTAGDNPLVTTVPAGGNGINFDPGSGINDYLAVIPTTDVNGNQTYANGYYRLMNSEELMIENTAKYFGRYENSVFVQPAATSAASGVTIGGAKIIWADSVTDGRMKIVDVARVSGAVDGARLPKETFYGMRVAQNNVLGVPDIYLMGHWNYPAGTVKTVYVASNASQVKLQTYDANGNLIKDYGFGSNHFFPSQILSPASDQVNKYVFAFDNVAFQPGYIQAQGYNDGSTAPVIQTSLTDPSHPSLKTAGDPASIKITPIPGPQGWLADGEDIVMFDVEVVDASGQRCPTFEDKVTFTAGDPSTGVFLGGYNTGVRYSTNIKKLTTYSLNIESGINRVFARSTRAASRFTLSATGTFINAAGRTIALSSNVAAVSSQAFTVTNGLTVTAPQKYVVPLGTEPTPVKEGVAPPPPSNAPQPAPASNVQGLAYSGTHQNLAVLVENAQPGDKAYVDANSITLPATLPGYLIGGEYIQPFLADNNAAPATDQCQFNLSRYSYLYLMIDASNGIPNNDNNSSYGWTKQAETVALNGRTMAIYKSVLETPYTPVFLASNNFQNAAPGFDGRSNMYLVFIVSAEEPLQNPGDPITGSTQQNTTTARYSNAIDGDVTTHWNALNGTFPQSITLTLPNPVNIGGYDINWTGNATKYYQYLVEVSATGADGTWLKSLDQSSNVTLGDYEYRVPAPLVQNSTNVRYVRITVSDASGGAYAAINEITVNGILTSTADTRPPVITSSLTPIHGQGGYAITPYTITASGNATGYAAQGLPTGLTINGVTGVISGTTMLGGTFPVTITAINGAGAGSAVLTFNLDNPPPVPVITSATTYPPSGTTIPAGAAIVAANTYAATATNTQYAPFKYLATFPANLGLGINATTGKITGTPKYPGTYTIALSASNPGGTGPVTNLAYAVAPSGTPPSITSANSATAYLGTAYTATSGVYTIAASGTPTLFGVSAPGGGTLPTWLKINTSTGVLYGTPDTLGDVSVVVSASNAGGTVTANVTLSVVRNPNAPVITSALTASGHVNTPFTYTIAATNSPTSYSATGLPAPLQINGNVISGTPMAAVTNTPVVLKATNSYGFDQQTLSLTIGPAVVKPVLSGPINAVGAVGSPFSCQYAATNTPTGYSFTPASGTTLPAWLKLDTVNGTLSGTPDATGTTTLTVTAFNDGGTSNAITLNLVISAAGTDINLALNKSTRTLDPPINGNVSGNAVDGSPGTTGTRWESPHNDTEWIIVDLGQLYTIHAINIDWETSCGKNYEVQVSSDGTTWTDFVPAIVGNTKSGWLYYNGNATAEFVRMSGTLRATMYGYSIYELQVMGPPPAGFSVPGGLAASPGAGEGQIALTWNAVAGAQAYVLQRSINAASGFATITNPTASATRYTDSDSALTAGQTYYYRLAVVTSQGTSGYTNPVSSKPYASADLAGWRYRYFGSAGLNPTDANGASDGANPAHDGVNNLLKYALGFDPTANYYAAYTSGLPVVQRQVIDGSVYLTLTFTGAATDVTYTVQAASALDGTWTTLATYSGQTALGTFTVPDNQPVGVSAKRFLRLQVSHP